MDQLGYGEIFVQCFSRVHNFISVGSSKESTVLGVHFSKIIAIFILRPVPMAFVNHLSNIPPVFIDIIFLISFIHPIKVPFCLCSTCLKDSGGTIVSTGMVGDCGVHKVI